MRGGTDEHFATGMQSLSFVVMRSTSVPKDYFPRIWMCEQLRLKETVVLKNLIQSPNLYLPLHEQYF